MSDGMAVTLMRLFCSEKATGAVTDALGKVITDLVLDPELNVLRITLADGDVLVLWDGGQSCCETRYMRTDDTLADFIGARFTGLDVKDAPDIEEPYGEVHEVQFLEVQTDRGVVTFSNHNEHNGYYGGFSIQARTE